LDLVVPDNPSLAYAPEERLIPLDEGSSALVVPIGLMAKKTLRDFDVTLDGKPLSVLTSRENGKACTAAVVSRFTCPDDLEALSADVERVVTASVGPEQPRTGMVLRRHDSEALSTFGEALLSSLEESFLLMILIPREKAGQRVVVKFSYHWDRVLSRQRTKHPLLSLAKELSTGWRPATGSEPMRLEVDLDGPDDAESYHLEFHAPPSLVFTQMTLPGTPPLHFGPGDGDPDMQVIQGHRRYDTSTTEPAVLYVAGTNSGPRMVALVVTLYTAVVFLASLFFPGAFSEWVRKGSQVTSLLMAVPAAAVAALNRPQENSLAAYFWRPLRSLVMLCAALLMCGAAALAVGWRWRPVWYIQWSLTGGGSLLAFLVILWGCRAKMRNQAPEEGERRESQQQ